MSGQSVVRPTANKYKKNQTNFKQETKHQNEEKRKEKKGKNQNQKSQNRITKTELEHKNQNSNAAPGVMVSDGQSYMPLKKRNRNKT